MPGAYIFPRPCYALVTVSILVSFFLLPAGATSNWPWLSSEKPLLELFRCCLLDQGSQIDPWYIFFEKFMSPGLLHAYEISQSPSELPVMADALLFVSMSLPAGQASNNCHHC